MFESVADYDQVRVSSDAEIAARKKTIRLTLFIAFVVFVPGLYYYLVAWAWAPVWYPLVAGTTEPFTFVMSLIPVAIYTTLEFYAAHVLANLVGESESTLTRLLVTSLIVFAVTTYGLFPLYSPLHGYSAPPENIFGLFKQALGPPLPGAC